MDTGRKIEELCELAESTLREVETTVSKLTELDGDVMFSAELVELELGRVSNVSGPEVPIHAIRG